MAGGRDPRGVVIGVDIGGTALKTGLVRATGAGDTAVSDVDSVAIARLPFADVLPSLEAAIRHHRAAASEPLLGIGVALPGLAEAAFGCRHLPGKVVGLEGFPLVEHLTALAGVPVRCVNDGAAATLAEWRFGVARGYRDVVGFTLGTGVGSGVVIGDRPLAASHLGAGLLAGHFAIDGVGGARCLCGSRGCAETRVSANAVVGRLRAALERQVPSSLAEDYARDPGAVTFAAFVAGAEAGDEVCRDILAEFVRDLGATVVTAIHAYVPEVVVLAGGPMAGAGAFLPAVQSYVDRHAFVFPKDRRVPLLPARLTSHAGVLGAAAMVLSDLDTPGR